MDGWMVGMPWAGLHCTAVKGIGLVWIGLELIRWGWINGMFLDWACVGLDESHCVALRFIGLHFVSHALL